MTDRNDLTQRIVDVLLAHTPSGAEGNVNCWCCEVFDSFKAQAHHVAEQIVSVLGDPDIDAAAEAIREILKGHR
jgi:hypothetical protein